MTPSFSAAALNATGGFDQCLQWGLDAEGARAFWLCQQWTRRPLRRRASHDITLAVMDRRTREVSIIHEGELSEPSVWQDWQMSGDWQHVQHIWASGSFAAQTASMARGKLFTPLGQASWQLETAPGEVPETLAWPLGGLRWRPASFEGSTFASGQALAGSFQGATVQRWGRLAAPGAFIQCLGLGGDAKACFTANSLQLASGWQGRDPVTAAVGSLRWAEGHIDFNRWWPSPTLDAARLDRYRWMGTLAGSTHRLDIVADGDNPRVTPWLALNVRQPGGLRQLLRITPFARLHLRLYPRGSRVLLQEWRHDACLLMTAQSGEQTRTSLPQAAP